MIKIGAIFIPVTDVKSSIKWYKEKLGLNHVGTWPEMEGADFYFSKEGQYLTLVKVEKQLPNTFRAIDGYQNSYYNFTTSDLNAYHQHLKQKGVQVSDIQEHGPIVGFDFYDVEGNKFSVIVDKENYGS